MYCQCAGLKRSLLFFFLGWRIPNLITGTQLELITSELIQRNCPCQRENHRPENSGHVQGKNFPGQWTLRLRVVTEIVNSSFKFAD